MSNDRAQTTPASPKRSPLAKLLQDKPFLIATVVLVTTAVLWGIAVETMGIVLNKKGLPWPAGCSISQDYRLLSLPKNHGFYKMVPGSDIAIPKSTLEPLKIGSTFDEIRYDERKSNWYLRRQYFDSRADEENPSPYDRWYLDVYFYNGGADTVPHIPERCRGVAGITGIQSDPVELDIASGRMPEGWRDWPGQVPFQRVTFNQKLTRGIQQHDLLRSEYYIFVVNGRPENNWWNVRVKMKSVWIEHCYFAKVQFGPIGGGEIRSPEESNQRAAEFIQSVLPDLLRNLPTAETADALNSDS